MAAQKQSEQMTRVMARYGVNTEHKLLRAIRSEWIRETGVRTTMLDAELILDQMLEAEFQRIEGGAYDR